MLDSIVCVCVGFVRRGLVGVVNPLVRSPCKGCKEEGRVSTWVPTRYGFESRIGRANLACKFRSKIIKPSNLMCFIETYREGITKISNKICSQKVTDSYESPKDTEAARLRLPVCVMW